MSPPSIIASLATPPASAERRLELREAAEAVKHIERFILLQASHGPSDEQELYQMMESIMAWNERHQRRRLRSD